jgi:hypothetical protein
MIPYCGHLLLENRIGQPRQKRVGGQGGFLNELGHSAAATCVTIDAPRT